MNRFKNIFLLIIIAFSINIYAFDEVEEDKLEVAFYDAGFLYKNGVGIDMDVIKELEIRLGTEFNHTLKPRARIWHELKNGMLPMSVSGIPTEERLEFARFVPYIAQKNKVVILKENSELYEKAEDFINDKNSKIAVVRSFRHGDFYDEFIKNINRKRVSEISAVEKLFFLLKNKRVDLIISLPVFYRYEFKNLNMESISEVKDWDKSDYTIIHGLVLSKTYFDENDYKKISKIILEMKEDGTLEEIFSLYLPKNEVEEALRF